MIICNLFGGLGNQMFQYACARSISLNVNAELKFYVDDARFYNSHNGIELDKVFNIEIPIATSTDLQDVTRLHINNPRIRNIICKSGIFSLFYKNAIYDSTYIYNLKRFGGIRKHAFLTGYWQSSNYFSDIEEVIRNDFTFKSQLDSKNLHIKKLINESNSVGLHIRRGDYITNPKANSLHGSCPLEYYKAAIDLLSNKTDNPVIFVFSDDLGWVKDNFAMIKNRLYFIDVNSKHNSSNDMRLMSLCKHNIIANSTFSWWSAWLNANPSKIVIAPKRWYAKRKSPINLIPVSWITI